MPITEEQLIEAIPGSLGYVSAIAKRLGCTVRNVYYLLDKYPEAKQAREDEEEKKLDLAELELHRQIKKGNIAAVIFYLKTKGKGRGFVERQEITGAEGEPVQIRNVEAVPAFEEPGKTEGPGAAQHDVIMDAEPERQIE